MTKPYQPSGNTTFLPSHTHMPVLDNKVLIEKKKSKSFPMAATTHEIYINKYDTFYFTEAGQGVTSTAAAVSMVSSFCVIYFVLVSKSNTTYHRIMLFSSVCDVVTSSMFAITTLPMPGDVIYPFEGKKIGSFASCQCQAFVYFVASQHMICANVALNIYYVCTIRYQMDGERFKKIIEPIVWIFVVILPLPLPIVLLHVGLLNPSPFETLCSFGAYPKECTFDDDVPCLRGETSPKLYQFIRLFFLGSMAFFFGTITFSMGLIVKGVHDSETSNNVAVIFSRGRKLKSGRTPRTAEVKDNDADGDVVVDDGDAARESSESPPQPVSVRRIIFRQAMMYIGAVFFTWIFSILTFKWEEEWGLQILKCIFQPSQGLFNALIFFYHKLYNIRVSNKDITFMEALYLLRQEPSKVPEVLVSRIDLVEAHANKIPSLNIGSQLESSESESASRSALSPISNEFSLQTPSPSMDLSDAMSSAGLSFGSKGESFVPKRGYYNMTIDPVEAAARIESKKESVDDVSLGVIIEEENASISSSFSLSSSRLQGE